MYTRYTQSQLDELAESGAVVEIPWQLIRPFANQPRKYFSKVKMAALCQSIAERGQNTPGEVRVLAGGVEQQFELVDGQRRHGACSSLDRPFRTWVSRVKDADDQYERSVLANFNQEKHPPLEIAAAVERIRHSPRITAFPKPEQIAAVGRTFGRSDKWVNDYLGLARLVPDLRWRLEPGAKKKDRMKIALAIRIASLPRDMQVAEWDRIQRKKLTARQANRHIDNTILKKGLHANRRGRKPSDDMEMLVRLLRRLEQDAADVLSLNDRQFGEMAAGRTNESRQRLLNELSKASLSLDRISQRFRAAAKAVPPAVK